MGCNEDWKIFEAPNEEAARKLAGQIMESDRHENGNSYSGTIGSATGVVVRRERRGKRGILLTRDQAHDLLFGEWNKKTGLEISNGIAEKWGPAVLIQIRCAKGSRKARWLLGAKCSS